MKPYRLVWHLLGTIVVIGTACSSSDDDASTTQTGTTQTGTTQTGTTQTGTTQTGTTQTGTTQTGTTQTGTGGGDVGCDIDDCVECINGDCANNLCAAEIDVCVANQSCVDLNDCWRDCTDDLCIETCDQQYPAGMDDLDAVYSCLICAACYVDCDGASKCQ